MPSGYYDHLNSARKLNAVDFPRPLRIGFLAPAATLFLQPQAAHLN